jgi:antitoxin (DNA-binding transcriptional repressor) of toxin-antitoxin stability system
MKFLSVRDLKTKSSQVWKELPDQKEMVITSNGRPIAILSTITENSLEQVLSSFRKARAAEAIASIQYESVRKDKNGSGQADKMKIVLDTNVLVSGLLTPFGPSG